MFQDFEKKEAGMINGSLVGPKLRVGDVVIFAENHEVPYEGKITRGLRYIVEDCYNLDANQTRITVRQLEANGVYNSKGEKISFSRSNLFSEVYVGDYDFYIIGRLDPRAPDKVNGK